MNGEPGGTRRWRAATLLAPAAFVAGALAAAVPASMRDAEPPPSGVVTYEAGGYRYTYHVLTGVEALFDERTDPRELHDLAPTDPALTREMRRALESKLRVESLDGLRRDREETIRRLRSLGYL